MIASKTIRVEMHCHTCYSHDGLITFDGMVSMARRRGLDAICITDHDTMEGAFDFQRRARKTGLPLEFVAGEERTLDDGSHLIGLFLQEPIRASTLSGMTAEVGQQGGAVLVPHPFRRKDGLWRNTSAPGEMDWAGMTAFEVFNAKISQADNERARTLLSAPLGVFGGSDAHYESDIGQCVCELPWAGTVEASIRALLRRSGPCRICAVRQSPEGGERRYAPLYYKVKPYVRVPKPLLPAAKQIYRWYRNHFCQAGPLQLEVVYQHE